MKHNLKDVTFTIPVKFDHNDRKENLELVICYLQTHFETNIIVGEMDEKPRGEGIKKFVNKYKFYPARADKAFHRTMMLNDMALMSETPIVVNYDTDVFFDTKQIIAAVEMLRQKKASGVYPYDGRFFRFNRKHFGIVQKSMSVDGLSTLEYPKHMHEQESFGGCIFWDKESFINGGMENENFISFGPEDYERYERFNRLNFYIARVDGPLYHADHFVGKDSNDQNPHFKTNWDEFDKIKTLPYERLVEYVSAFKWLPAGTVVGQQEQYNQAFFQKINEGALAAADVIIPELKLALEFKTVLDVGCGQGAWGVNFNEKDYMGVDGDYVKPESLLIDPSQFKAVDVSKPFNLRKKFDLVISLEVAEHLPEHAADTFIDNLCKHGDTILFSAAIPGQGGNGHLNEQWQSYWAKKFKAKGYRSFDIVRPFVWNADIEYYYKQNIIVYSKKSLTTDNEQQFITLDIVHPDKYKQLLLQ